MDDGRERAIRRLQAKRGFRRHLVVYAVINASLAVIWGLTPGGYFWPVWPMVGWGIGLALHGWGVYGERPITEAEIQREMEKDGVTEPTGAVTSPR